MEKEKNARHCYSCRHFCRYFTMGAKKFTPANYCGNCIDWRRREKEYDFSVERFSEVRHDLKIIFDILFE